METLTLSNTDEESDLGEEPDSIPGGAQPFSVLVIYSFVEKVICGEASDLLADQETLQTTHSIVKALRHRGFTVTPAPVRTETDLRIALRRYTDRRCADRRNPLLVFNLCECLSGDARAESRVPQVLEEFQIPYVGATAQNLYQCLNKDLAKARLMEQKIPTAPYQVFTTGDEPLRVSLPAIVKPVAEDGSLGISTRSVVKTSAELAAQVGYVLSTYRQPALVEAFLDGREFSASLWGNDTVHLFSISEMDFSACKDHSHRILSFSEKWTADEQFPSVDPAPIDASLRKRIRSIACAAYRAMGCRDYARVDLREQNGQVFVLEVNPNPCLAENGGFAKAARSAGLDYPALMERLVRQAWRRAGAVQERIYACPVL